MLVILVVIVVLAVVVAVLIKFCKQETKLYILISKLKKKIFWNSLLRFMLQGYLKIALGVALAIYFMLKDTEIANGIITIILALIICLLPIVIAILLHKNREQLT